MPEHEIPRRDPSSFDSYDPAVAAALAGATLDDDDLPGFLGLRHLDAGPGFLRAELDVRDELKTPFGNLHGGVIAALCDHVLGTVCYPVIAKGSWAATTEFKLNYLAPVTHGTLTATATIVALTRRTAVITIDVENNERAVAVAQGTVLIMAAQPA